MPVLFACSRPALVRLGPVVLLLASLLGPVAGVGPPAAAADVGAGEPGKGSWSARAWDDEAVRALRPSAVRPLPGPLRTGRRFEPPPRPWLPGHRGVDLVGSTGAAVRSVLPGRVVFAGSVAGTPLVSVDHQGLRVTYQPLVPAVAAGDTVAAGQPLGTLVAGHPGCTARACLHLGLRVGASTYLDPLLLLGGREVRLLPLTGAGR